jgi:hypothetical protein
MWKGIHSEFFIRGNIIFTIAKYGRLCIMIEQDLM